MTKIEFRSSLDSLGWTQREFALRTGIVPQTITAWLSETNPIPKWVDAYLGVMLLLRKVAVKTGVAK